MYWSTSLFWGESSTAPFFYSRSTTLFSLLLLSVFFFRLHPLQLHRTTLLFSFAVVSSKIFVYFHLFSSACFFYFYPLHQCKCSICKSCSALKLDVVESNQEKKPPWSLHVRICIPKKDSSANLTLAWLVRECIIYSLTFAWSNIHGSLLFFIDSCYKYMNFQIEINYLCIMSINISIHA